MKNLSVGLLMLLAIFGCSQASSDSISGTLTDEGNGEYSVDATGSSGRHYSGDANDDGSGSYALDLEDDKGNNYSGSLSSDGNNNFSVDASADDGDSDLTGNLTLDN